MESHSPPEPSLIVLVELAFLEVQMSLHPSLTLGALGAVKEKVVEVRH